MKVRIGMVGIGGFSDDFIRLLKMHPDVEEMAVADLLPERVEQCCLKYGIKRGYKSLDDMLENGKDLNAVAIFTQRHLHGPMIIKALEYGKHVFSAVPIGCTYEEIEKIIKKVKETRLIYMMGETCYYYPCAIYCRNQYKRGEFGKFVYGESQYYHDMSEMYQYYKFSGGDSWKRVAGIPPMFYPTHSTSMLFSAIGEYATSVSCMGFYDNHEDNIFGKGKNDWDNPFSNETAIFRMSNGGVARINECRRIGTNKPSSFITGLYGDKGSYEYSVVQHIFQKGEASGERPYVEYLNDLLNAKHITEKKNNGTLDWNHDVIVNESAYGYAPIHDVDRLPAAYRLEPPNGHFNSHPFLVDDFVRAVVDEKLPPNNAWDSARYMISGLVAHESALKDGELMKVPDLGNAPDDWEKLTFPKKDYYEE